MTIFHRGMKVACTDSSNYGPLGYGDDVLPTQGEVYTVRDILIDHFGVEGLLLDEIRNDRLPYTVGKEIIWSERSIASWRFQPLVSGERDLEIEGVV